MKEEDCVDDFSHSPQTCPTLYIYTSCDFTPEEWVIFQSSGTDNFEIDIGEESHEGMIQNPLTGEWSWL